MILDNIGLKEWQNVVLLGKSQSYYELLDKMPRYGQWVGTYDILQCHLDIRQFDFSETLMVDFNVVFLLSFKAPN